MLTAEYDFQIRNIEINVHRRLSFTALANILQECASLHAASLGASTLDLMREGRTWVLSKLKISMTGTVQLGEKLTVITWPEGARGVRAFRGFDIRDGQGRNIGSAESIWLVLDSVERRVVPVPEPIAALRGGHDKLHYNFRKRIEEVGAADFTMETKVGWHDLDINNHVNNNHYLRWAVESFPYEFLHAHVLRDAEMIFLGEARYGDNIIARSSKEQGRTFVHEIQKEGAAVLFRAVTQWDAI